MQVIKTFADKHTHELYTTGKSKRLPADILRRALRRMEYIDHATCVDDLRVPPSNRLHILRGNREGQYSISINEQWRICFRFIDGDAYDVEITDITERCVMSIKNIETRQIKPTHPGEMLMEDFMPDFGLTAATIAEKLGVSRQTVNEILRERRAVSPSMALRLSRLFGNTPEFWLNAQRSVDLWRAQRENKTTLGRIRPLKAA